MAAPTRRTAADPRGGGWSRAAGKLAGPGSASVREAGEWVALTDIGGKDVECAAGGGPMAGLLAGMTSERTAGRGPFGVTVLA